MPIRTRFLLTLAATLIVTMQIGVAGAVQAQPTAEQRAQYRASMQRADQAMALIGRADRAIDRSQLDPVALVGRLDADPDRIVAFVRNRIAYQPYPGALRWVRGTLMTRAGNALDQSVLLAALLHDAGYEARINYAPLSAAQSRQVLVAATRPAVPPPPPINIAALNAVAKAAPASADPALKTRLRQAMQPPVYTGPPATVMASWLMQSLHKAGVRLDSKAALARLVKWSKDYFWVEYRSDPWAKWKSVQPVFANAKDDFTHLAAQQRFSNTVPDKWLWRLHLDLTIEAKRGAGLDTTHLLDWTRPVAALVGKPLSIAVSPTNLSSRVAFKNLPRTLAQAQLFSASFDGARTGDLFDLSGNTIDPDVLSGGIPGAAGVFMTMNKKAQAAAGALAALGGHVGKAGRKLLPVQVLTGVWIDVTVIPPDGYGRRRHARRYLLDRIGDTQRRAGKITHLTPMKPVDIARRLTRSYTFVVSGGKPAAGLLLQHYLGRIKRQRPLIKYGLELGYLRKDDGIALAEYLQQQKPAVLTQLGLLRTSVGNVRAATSSYRPAPAIVAIESGFGEHFQPVKQTDIVFDPVAMLPPHGSPTTVATSATASPAAVQASPNLAAALAAGVRMTRLETAHPKRASKRVRHVSAYGQLAAAQRAGVSLEVLRPGASDADWNTLGQQVTALKLPRHTRDALLRDLHAGFVVAIPHHQQPSSRTVAWWRVDPMTGETLGMAGDGRGAEFAEYLSTLNMAFSIINSSARFLLAVSTCTTPCCTLRAAASLAAGGGIGLVGGVLGLTLDVKVFAGLAILGRNVTNTILGAMGKYTLAGAAGAAAGAVCSGS